MPICATNCGCEVCNHCLRARESPHLIEDCSQYSLCNPSKWVIRGHSKAGERTGFILENVPGGNILLDAGMNSTKNIVCACLTHSHCDHNLELPKYFSGRKVDSAPIKGQKHLCGRPVLMPESCVNSIQKLLEAVIALSNNEVIITKPEDIWKQQDFVDKDGKSVDKAIILQAKKNGLDITDKIDIPELAFYCDSTIENLKNHSEWKKYPVIMCECTGYPEKHTVEGIRDKTHTHLDELMPIMLENKDKQ